MGFIGGGGVVRRCGVDGGVVRRCGVNKEESL